MAVSRGHPSAGRGALPVAALAFALATTASGAGSEPAQVRPSTTGNGSELVETVPITSDPGKGKRVVMSLSPNRLGELREDDRLRISSELQVTTDCISESARCAGRPYPYSPKVDVKLILARSAKTVGGSGARRIGTRKRKVCRQGFFNREHHCVITFQRLDLKIGRVGGLPCAPGRCRINMVVDAHNSRANGNEVLVIGANKPDGKILQDRGRINAIRLRGGRAITRSRSTSRRRRDSVRPDGEARVVYSLKLHRLRPRESLAARAKLVTTIDHLPYAVRTSAQLIAARRPGHTRPRGYVKRGLTLKGEVTERNGFNCTQRMKRCVLRKAGLVVTRSDWRKIAGRRPVYLNLVLRTNPKRVAAGSGDRVRVDRRGSQAVRIYTDPD